MHVHPLHPLYEYGDRFIHEADFLEALQKAGVKCGEVLMVHSDISVFGKLALFDRNGLCQALVNALKNSIGEQGTLIMPTFTYSFCRGEVFDPDTSPSTVGVLTEYFRRQPGSLRTRHPIFSAAVQGKHQADLQNIGRDAFGHDSIFGKLHALKGRLVFFGTSMQACTYIHYVEQCHGIPYRFMKTFSGTIREKDREYPSEATYFVRYLDRNVNLDLQRFESYLLQQGLMQEVCVGHGRILTAEADVIYQAGCQLLDEDIYYFLKEKPSEGTP